MRWTISATPPIGRWSVYAIPVDLHTESHKDERSNQQYNLQYIDNVIGTIEIILVIAQQPAKNSSIA